ncbi:MAG: cytidine deaminase [Kiritimatiellaceae bacterium]|nr:cytidine deaminase [Kiritimatiellaceae bacterium]
MNPEELIKVAFQALEHAHAPYSEYLVGAALLCADGSVFLGCNVENASYGLTNCAERTAIFSAVAAGQREFKAMAIAASGEQTPYPCGACRQVMAEFCQQNFPVHVAKTNGFETVTLGELLPNSFESRTSDA